MKKKVKIILSVLIFCLAFYNVYSGGRGVRLSYIKYSGDYGYIFKPATAIEYHYLDNSCHFRLGFSIGFYKLETRLDTFPTYSIITRNHTSTLNHAYLICEKYVSIPIGFNMEYKIFDKAFSPSVGIDFYFHLNIFESTIKTATSSYSTNSSFHAGILPKIGFSYDINEKFIIDGGLAKAMLIGNGFSGNDFSTFEYWKTFISIRYIFDLYYYL